MYGNHNIHLQWTVTIAHTYKERLPYHLLTMNGYHKIKIDGTITSTYNEWLPYHLLIMNGYHRIFLQ